VVTTAANDGAAKNDLIVKGVKAPAQHSSGIALMMAEHARVDNTNIL
jgi:hypothetical protein